MNRLGCHELRQSAPTAELSVSGVTRLCEALKILDPSQVKQAEGVKERRIERLQSMQRAPRLVR
jgi:hypothetical protein